MKTTLRLVMGAALALALAPRVADANIVVNGGFETGDFTGWTQSGNTGFSGVQAGAFGTTLPPEGLHHAYFGPVGSVGGIYQDLPTTPGGIYQLSFDMANLGGTPNSVEVLIDGVSLGGLVNDPGFPYSTFGGSFTAPDSLSTLEFRFQHDPSYWLLDDVVVVVPEPSQVVSGLVLLLGAAGYVYRKRQAARQ